MAAGSNTIIKKLTKNSYFGEISFFSSVCQHNCSVLTSDFTTLFLLKKKDFLEIFQDPEFKSDRVDFLIFKFFNF